MSFQIENLNFQYDLKSEQAIIKDLSLCLKKDKITCLIGPSGCGKTTLLKLMAGMLKPISGVISEGFMQERAFIFQEPRLMPWLTTYENMAFVLPETLSEIEKATQIQTCLSAVKLWEYRDYFPEELSGGMQQRIAIARGFLKPSSLMLMDEPLKSLDVEIKLTVMDAFKSLWQKSPKTVLMVTHDALDAVLLADEIILLTAKPTREKKVIENPIAEVDRRIDHPEVGRFQSQLYGELLGTRHEG